MLLNLYRRLLPRLQALPARVVLTLLLAWAAAGLCVMLRIPLPWMIGPMLVTAVVSMLGSATASWTPLRNVGQWIIGCALGLYFTPQVVALVAGLWWAIALNIVWALLLGLAFGRWLHWVHRRPGLLHMSGLARTTSYFATPVGAASEMTLMAERHGAQTELVASAHSLRVLLVTLIFPSVFNGRGCMGWTPPCPARAWCICRDWRCWRC